MNAVEPMTNTPDDLPTYVQDTIENHAEDTDVLAAIRDYAEELHTAADEESPDPAEIAAEKDGEVERIRTGDDGWTYVQRRVKCGDDSCHCADGSSLHGPYWYKTRRNDEGGLTWKYVGKKIETDDAGAENDDPEAGAA